LASRHVSAAEPFFVIEADEYDNERFFDKRSKFIPLPIRCAALILNNLEFDHVPIFSPTCRRLVRQFPLLRAPPCRVQACWW